MLMFSEDEAMMLLCNDWWTSYARIIRNMAAGFGAGNEESCADGTAWCGREANCAENFRQIPHCSYNICCSLFLFSLLRLMSDLPPPYPAWPVGGGALGALIRTHDWAATPLGPLQGWPAALRTLVDLVVHSPLPMAVLWGPDLIQVYNDGYAAICGPRHPQALGQPHRPTWPQAKR
ncbi:MAG: hypothetical protein EOO79_11180 [Oxalobacteraceae bacterium]|nr:MAG: hypothetical protein EOO79_11180 [Oxalobacteraceae bacterium]